VAWPGSGAGDAEVGGDAGGGVGMVAGDHDDPQAGAVGLGDGGGRLRAWWVDDADHAGEDQPLLQGLVGLGRLGGLQGEVGDGQRAQRRSGEAIDRGHDR
jgi:hypothetical protein